MFEALIYFAIGATALSITTICGAGYIKELSIREKIRELNK